MNPRITKDFRLIAPAWLLTMALMIAAAFLPQFGKEWAVTIVVFGSLIIAASIFGAEFSHGTLPQLLAQPIDRRRIWGEKMLVMAAALASLFAILVATEHTTWPVAIIAAAFCTVPFFTLVGRSTIAGIILAVPIPGLIFVFGGLLGLWLLRPEGELVNEERLHFWMRTYMYTVLPVYCVVVFYLSYRRLLNFELAGGEHSNIRLPISMQARVERLASSLIPSKYRDIRALVAKELHLQHNSTILFLLFLGLQLLDIAFLELAYPKDPGEYFVMPLFFCAGTMPLVIGSSAIAEETNLGTRAWHLTLPISIRTQWFVKLSVVSTFAIVFAILVPLFWLWLGWNLGLLAADPDILSALWLFFYSPVLLVTLIAFYASSFSRDTLRALLTAFAICASIVFISVLGGTLFEWSGLAKRNLGDATRVVAIGWVLLGMAISCLLFLLLRSSFTHFASLDRRRIWTNLLAVVLSPILLFFLLLIVAFLTR